MEDTLYDFWAATLQNGYIGDLIVTVERLGGAKSFYKFIEKCSNGYNRKNAFASEKLIDYFVTKLISEDEIKRNYEEMKNKNISYVNHTGRDFPTKLKNIPSPPYGLFYKGCLPSENKSSVAIVGARECSEYGRVCAQYFGDKLARLGIQIISGMAWGIDGLSQMAAVKAGGNSFSVLGCGVDVIYPRKNRELYEMLTENGNGVMSEYAPNTLAVSRLFPPRNRIISGLSDVLLVVEARPKSGTLITVKMAIEQGKSIMTVPGRITDELSRGCLLLIRDGAAPAISIDSVLEELKLTGKDFGNEHLNLNNAHREDDFELNEREKAVLETLSLDPVYAEDISKITKTDISEVLIILSKLDIKGYAKEVYNGAFVKCISKN